MLHKMLLMLGLSAVTLFAAPVPTASGAQPGSQLIGESFNSQVCFTNTGDATGFGPQFEMVTPAGITLTDAEFYSFGAITYQETCTVSECNVTNPQTAEVRTIYENESFYILDYPIGSFSTEWPQQCIDLTFALESSGANVQLGNPLDIQTYPLFTLGATAVDDGTSIYGAQHTMTVDPTVYTLEKSNNATEGERATGLRHPITATLLVDIANGEDVNSLQVVDILSGGMQFISLDSDGGCNISAPLLPSTTSPGGTLTLECGNVTGVLGTDRTITYTYYIPDRDNNNDSILGPNGQWQTLINEAEAKADYNGTTLTPAEANSTVIAKAITMHKTSALTNDVSPAGFGPGDTVTYTLTMDISDYFNHDDTIVTDILGDGQHVLDPLVADYNLSSGQSGIFSASNIDVCAAVDPVDGTCPIDFNLSNELSGVTITSGTTITISFNAIIDTNYQVINNAGYISMGDSVGNGGSVQSNIPGVGVGIPDSSSTSNSVATEQLVKTIYAINDSTAISAPYKVFPGDRVTYRLKSVMPVESFYDLNITDYLPIPIFVATEIAAGPDGNAIPSAGTWGAGPDNNYDTSVPILSTNAAQNTITWAFNDDQDNDQATVVDILFTVTATNEPMADSLELANIAGTKYNNSAGNSFGTAGIVNLETQEPFISALYLKSISNSTNPNSTFIPAPIGYENAMNNVDANDTITYKIHLENSGHAIAYDVNVTDRISRPAMLCDLNSIVVDTNSTGVGSGDLFAGMYTIDKIEAGAYYDITYTCVVDQNANPGPDIDNTATLVSYASQPGGPNFVNKVLESKTKLELTGKMEIVKNIASTSIPDTSGNSINQGEIVYFDINVTLGEGTYTNYELSDNTCTNLQLTSTSANVTASGLSGTVIVDGTGGSVDGSLLYTCEKQAIISGTNTATVIADLMDSKTDSTNWTVVAPNVVTAKNMNPDTADAGDTVTITMDWTNDPVHPAYQCTVTDPLDASVFDISTINITTTPSGYTCSDAGNEVKCTYTGDLTLPCPDGPAVFTVNVRDDINTSSNLVNELTFTGVTLPDGHTGETNTTINGSVESNATDTLDLLSPVAPVKIFTATSEDFTDPGDVRLNNTPAIAIGEVIDVNITYGFYEGTTLNVDLDERFLDGGRLVYVPGTMTISRDNANLFVEDIDINASLSGSSVGTAVAVDDTKLSISNTLIRLHLGDVLNNNSSTSTSAANFTLHFRVKVENESSVQAGVLIRDRGRVLFEDGASGTLRNTNGNIRSARTFEPLPTITKDVNQTSVQAGTQLTYTLKVCNDETNSSSYVTSGFDWNISDRLPDDILPNGTNTVDLNGTGATVNVVQNGQELNATIDRLNPGECITISYEAIVRVSAQFGQILTNTAGFTTTSLPGIYGTAGSLTGLSSQEPGEINGERTGSGTGVNDLFGTDSMTVIMNKGSINKELVSPKQYYAIGETVHYKITVDMLPGEAKNFIVHDLLPVGLDFNVSDVTFGKLGVVTEDNYPPIITETAGNVISFDYGDINATTASQYIIDYNVTVVNTLTNQDGVLLQNDANVSFNDPNNVGSLITVNPVAPALPARVGEPNFFMQKSITVGAVKAQAGSTVSWEVEMSNNGHTTAYATEWIDILPSHLAQISNASLVLDGTPAVLSSTSTPLTSLDLIENNTTLSLPLFDLPVGSKVTVTFDSIVQNDAVAGETQTNNTNASYQSILGADGSPLGGRNSLDCGDDDDSSTLNNYCESAIADLIIDAGIAIDKNLQGMQTNYTIGEFVTYDMRISLIEGITPNVMLTDTLPAGLKYVSHTHQNGAPAMIYDFASADQNGGGGQTVIIDFGDVNNSVDGNSTNDYIDVELTVLVENVVGNQNGDTPSNGDPSDGSSVTVTSDANSSEVTVPVPITITEPDLNVTKTVTPDTQSTGDVVTYSIRLAHTAASTSEAFDINFTDTLPTDLTYIPGSATGATVTQNGQVLTFGFANLALAATRDISYKARIDDNASIATPLVNLLDIVYAGLPDANGTADGGRNGTDGVGGALNDYALHTEASVQPNHNELNITKAVDWLDQNGDGLINAGDYLDYNISVYNPYGYSLGDVNITDPIPTWATYLPNTLALSDMLNGNTIDDSVPALMQAWITELLAGETNYLTFSVIIDADTPPGTDINNTASVDSNQTIPTESPKVTVRTDQRGIAGIPDKDITDSDQIFTTLPNVAVGEVIDVNLSFAFSGGTTRDVKLRDNYNSDQFAFVLGSAILTRSSTNIHVSESDLNSSFESSGALEIPVSDAKIAEDSTGFELALGDVFNSNYQDLNMTEDLILSFKLQVKNTTSVNISDTLDDRGDVTYLDYNRSGGQPDKNITLQSDIVSVTVLEPLPGIKKVNSNAAAQPGDPVTYTVTFCNDEAGTAADVSSAFDWTATDILDARLQPQGTPRTDAGSTGAVVSASFSAQSLSVTIDQLDQGECVNVEYDILIAAGAAIDANITNTINMQTTSLPGTVPGERTGTGTPVENDLHAFATSNIIIGQPSILKDVTAQKTFYAIGESVDYNVTINLPESVGSLEINDTLPAGLNYNAGSVRLVVPAGVTVENSSPVVSQNGNVVTFALGDVTMPSKQTIYLEFNATVENIGANQQGSTLTNQVNMAYIEPDNNRLLVLPNVDAPAITLGEPTIVMTKMVTAGLVDSQAGDTVSYSVTLQNTGTTTAFDTDWGDTLPEHLAEISNVQISGTAYQSGTTTALVDGDVILSTVNATDDTVALPAFDLPVGNTLTITFDSIVQLDAIANEILNNNTTSTWKSTLDIGARDGTDGIGGILNDYAAEANASVEINATIAIQKSLLGDTTYTIGEELTYKLSVYFIRGITPDVSVTDVLPDGLSYVSHSTQSTNAGLTFASDTKSGSGQTVIISLGDVNNSATNDDSIDIELKVRVDNVPGNQDGDQPANGGDAAGTSVTAAYNTPGVGITEANVINPVIFTITEPDISVTKNVTPDTQALGDEVTYTIHVTNGGTSTAYDLNLTDTLPIGLTYVDGSSSEAGVIHNGQLLTFVLAPLASGASVDISYKATVDTTADINLPLINSINGIYGSILDSNGSLDGGRNGIDGIGGLNNYVFEANATLQPNIAALTPVKSVTWEQDSNNDTLISAGDLLQYNLSVTNDLAYDVGEVNATDTLSPDVTLLLNSVEIDGVAVGNDEAWSFDGTWYRYANASNDIDLTYNVVTNYFEIYSQRILASTDTLDITFDVKINDGNFTEVLFLDGNTTQLAAKPLVNPGTFIENIFTVDSNRTVPTDSNEVNVTTDQRGIVIEPVKRLTATDQSFTDPGDLNLANTPPVAVGEIVDVELLFEFSGGTTRTVVLRDNFDLQNFVYVPGSTELELSSDRIEVSDADLNSSFASANPITVADSKIIHDANGFSLDVGDVFNDNYNAMNVTESLIMRFKLRVDNNDTVQAGVILNDHGGVSFSEYDPVTYTSSTAELNSTEVGVRVVEADVEITKTVDPLSASSGDILTYTIKVCNDESNSTANTTSAFDWVVTDTLPDEFDLVGDPQYNGTSMFSGQDLSVVIDVIVPGDCVTLEYNVTVNGSAQFEQDINNTVRVEGTSLPGPVSGERTGTGILPNDLNSSSTATLSIEEPGVIKTIIGQKEYYPIGDIVEYNITLGFTGSARDLTIVDHFPAGLAYVPGSARLRLPTGATVSYDPPQESNIGYDWTFIIGDLNITTAENLYLELNATVKDILSNVEGTPLTNSLEMSFTDPNTGATVTIPAVSPSVTVGEPELYVTKTITTDLSVPKSAGDSISYQIEIANSGTTTAYKVEWEDKVPVHTGEIHNAHQQVHAGTAYETNTTTPLSDASFIITTVDEPDDMIVLQPFDLSPGATLVITFDTIIQPNVIPAETLVNITEATTQSTVSGGRTPNGINGERYTSVANVSFSINQLPEAIDDCNPPLLVTHYGPNPGDLASNDILGDGTKAEHTWNLVTPPSHGTVVVHTDGTYIYSPDADYNNGPDGFTYEMEDSNGDRSQGKVCIDVYCASSQTSDGGDALGNAGMLLMLLFTAMTGLYFIRREENRDII